MQRRLCAAMVVLGVVTTVAAGKRAYIPPAPERLASATCAVIGKITEIEKNSVMAAAAPGSQDKLEYQIAVIKIGETLGGDLQGLTHVRLGIPANYGINLGVDVEGCFFLTPHHDQAFYVLQGPAYSAYVTQQTDPAGLEVVRRCSKLLKDPLASLKSKDADERFLTAAMLMVRYRLGGIPPQGFCSEPIAAEESKLILEALRDADWNRNATDRMHPQQAFSRLQLKDKDGWQQPADFSKYPAAAKDWLTKNAGSYRIERFVPIKK
ncbi:MAG: hypothetical protein AB7K24_03575 [Gemmataceae bacterium]